MVSKKGEQFLYVFESFSEVGGPFPTYIRALFRLVDSKDLVFVLDAKCQDLSASRAGLDKFSEAHMSKAVQALVHEVDLREGVLGCIGGLERIFQFARVEDRAQVQLDVLTISGGRKVLICEFLQFLHEVARWLPSLASDEVCLNVEHGQEMSAEGSQNGFDYHIWALDCLQSDVFTTYLIIRALLFYFSN